MTQGVPADVVSSLQHNLQHWSLRDKAQAHLLHTAGADAAAAIQEVLQQPHHSNLIRSAAYTARHDLPTDTPCATSSSGSDGICSRSGRQEVWSDPALAAALSALQADWQALVMSRLTAAQQLLSPTPLVATASSSARSSARQRAGPEEGEGAEAWERLGAARSSLYIAAGEVPVLRKLLYDASDLLAALSGGLKRAAGVGGGQPEAGGQQQQGLPAIPSAAAAVSEGGAGSSSSSGGGGAGADPLPGPLLLELVPAPEWPWLQSFFGELRADQRQTGLDDVLHPWYAEQQLHQVQLILSSASTAAARAAARTGLPPALRPGIWAAAMAVQTVTADSCSNCLPGGSQGGQPAPQAAAAAGGGGGAAGEALQQQHQQQQQGGQQQQQQQHGSSPSCLLQPSARDADVLRLLCTGAEGQQLLVDALTCADVQRVADSPQYFVFEDTLRAVLLAFSRDPSISSSCAATPHPCAAYTPPSTTGRRGGRAAAQPPPAPPTPAAPPLLYPPSGVLPHQGLATLAAPLCYVYEHPALVYRMFVAMYCRYWCRLTSWGGGGAGEGPAAAASLPGLCKTFLSVLTSKDPDVARHLVTLRYPPLQVALPWLCSGFVGYLGPGEVLALWDRVLGYDSLLVLPLLAAAVLIFRRDLILAATSGEELVEVMEDLGALRVVPLLQALLFDS